MGMLLIIVLLNYGTLAKLILAKLASKNRMPGFMSLVLHVLFILLKNLVMALLNELVEHKIWNFNLPGVELPTHRWHKFRHRGERVFYSI
jgi:hypothetical protein